MTEDDAFWASFGELTPEKYQEALRVDGDEPSQDYSVEEQMITEMESQDGAEQDAARERRRAAWRSVAEDHPWGGPPDHLEKIREGWPD